MKRRTLRLLRGLIPLVPLASIFAVVGIIGAVEATLAPPPPRGCCAATEIAVPPSPAVSAVDGRLAVRQLRPVMYAARLTYSGAAKLQLVAFLAAILGGLFIGIRQLRLLTLPWRLTILALTLAVGGIAARFAISPRLTPASTLLIGRTIAAECGNVPALHLTLDRMTMALAFFLTVVMCLALVRPSGSLSARLRRMAEGQRAVTAILILSTIFLAVSIFRITAIGRWVETYYPDPPVAAGIHALFDAVVQTWGVYYSMMLAAVYVPSTILLRSRIARAARALPSGSPPEWLDPDWLKTSYAHEVMRIVAVLAPFVAGQSADLLRIG